MASILKVDSMQGVTSAGDITITGEGGTGTMQLQNGVLKAWRKYTTITTTANTDSFNFSSITDNGTGDTNHNFTNSMTNATYTIMHNTQFSTFSGYYNGGTLTTSAFRTGVYNASNAAVDVEHNFVHIAGDLA
jgi:hypothetical protein